MADISNKLNKESLDLAGAFVEVKTNTSDFGVALTDATKSMAEFSEQYKKTAGDIPKATKGIMDSLKAALGKAAGAFKKVPGLTKLAALGPLGAITGAATLLFKQLLQVSDTIASISKDTGLIGKQLKAVFKEVKLASGGMHAFGMSMEDTAKQAVALHQSLGNTTKVTHQLITVTSKLQKAMGGSAQESANLAANLIKGFGKTAPQIQSFAENMMNFATNSGVNARRLMRDISNDSNLTAIYLGRGETYLKNTAVFAAKMGKSMADITATADAFNTIEGAAEITGKLNQFFGGNLNALKMYNNYVKGDVLSSMNELNKLFSSPRGLMMIEKMPGHAKTLGAEIGMTISEMRNMKSVIQDLEKAQRGPTKQQADLNQFIMEGMTLLQKLKGIVATVLMPVFTSLSNILNNQINPVLNQGVRMAETFGAGMSKAMDKASGFSGKLKAAFVHIMEFVGPYLDMMGARIGAAIRRGMVGESVGSFLETDFGFGPRESTEKDEAFFAKLAARASPKAVGDVISKPTFAMVGEENRSEVIIPTERIRKGLPVAGSVARELSSIGVPGFAYGATGPSAAAVATFSSSQRKRSQESMLYGSQSDPGAIKRREQQIAEQSRKDRAAQAAIIEKIVKLQEEGARREEFDGPGSGRPGRTGKGPGGRNWQNSLHKWAKGLDNFMKLTNTSWADIYKGLPKLITKPIDKMFSMLPKELQLGLMGGTKVAWDEYLATGNFDKALIKGVASGIKMGLIGSGEFAKGVGNVMSDHIAGKSWRKSLGNELTTSLNDPSGHLGFLMSEMNDTLTNTHTDAAKQNKEANRQINDAKLASQEQLKEANRMTEQNKGLLGGDRYSKEDIADLRMLAELNAQEAKKVAKDNRNAQMKMALKQGAMAGGAAGLQAGVDTFASTGSFKEAGKSALASGVGSAVGMGATAALTPYLGPLAPLAGGALGSLAEFGVNALWGGGKKPLHGAGARAKVVGGLAGALRVAKKPGGEQLYEAFKAGSPGNTLAKKNIDAAMTDSEGNMSEGLKQELINSIGGVIQRSTGVRFSSDDILTLLAGLKGTGMQNHEQKQLLTNYERRIEGVGARGAIVNRPTVALIGEAGPEAVTPLDKTAGNSALPGGGGDLAGEIRQMNRLLAQYVSNPPPINIDGQRVSRVINAANSDDIRTGVSTVNSRI